MKVLLLPIKPEYIDRILEGTKKYEFRRRLAKEDVSLVYVYGTAPLMKVVASFQVMGRLSASPLELWKQTKNSAGISEKKFIDYFHDCDMAYAYQIGNVNVFDQKKDLSDFGVATPPQSFMYIEV